MRSILKTNTKAIGGDNEELIGLKDVKSGQYSVILIGDQKVIKLEKVTIVQ